MALEKTIEYKGVSITDAYCKLINLIGNKSRIQYTIGVFSDKESSNDNFNIITTYSDEFTPSQSATSLRWDNQAYVDAKSKTYLQDAVDLLDEGQII